MYLICNLTSHDHLTVCHHPDNSCDHRHCDSGGIMIVFLICHVTSPEYIFKGLYEFMGGSPSVNHQLAMFAKHCPNASGDIKYLKTSQNHMVIKGSGNFMSGSCSWYVTILPSLVAQDIVVVEMF